MFPVKEVASLVWVALTLSLLVSTVSQVCFGAWNPGTYQHFNVFADMKSTWIFDSLFGNGYILNGFSSVDFNKRYFFQMNASPCIDCTKCCWFWVWWELSECFDMWPHPQWVVAENMPGGGHFNENWLNNKTLNVWNEGRLHKCPAHSVRTDGSLPVQVSCCCSGGH